MQANKEKQKDVTKLSSRSYSSSEESEESLRDTKKLNKIVKSEQKNKIVRNIFLNVSKSDGGAKGKGQVMIVDHSEDSQKPIMNLSRDCSLMSNINIPDSRLFTSIPIICRIDLSRLTRIPHSNHNNTDQSKHCKELEVLSKVKYNYI